MPRSNRTIPLTLVLALVGCRIGPKIEDVVAVHTPAGIATEVRTRASTYQGELLAVAEDGLLLLVDERLTSVPFGAIEHVNSEPVLTGPGSELRSAKKEKLRKWSRFPQGVSDELERALLTAYDQVEVTRVEG